MSEKEQSSMMTCGMARRLTWSDGTPRVVDASTAGAEAHVSQCAACQAFVADMRESARRIAEGVPRDGAPQDVRERLFAALAHARVDGERVRLRRRLVATLTLGAAAALAGIMFTIWRSLPGPGTPAIAARLADDHLRSLHTDSVASSDTGLVARWLSVRVGFVVHAPVFANGVLVGGRVADVDRQRGAVLSYRVDGRDVSYFIVRAPSAADGGAAGAADVQVSSWSGVSIAAWQHAGLTHALIADLPASRLTGLAHECIRQMMAAVDRPEWLGAGYAG